MDTEAPNHPIDSRVVNLVDAHIARRIRRRRDEQKLCSETLSQLTGLGIERIRQIEDGTSPAAPAELYALADALDVKIHYFFERPADDPAPPPRSWIRDVERWFGANISPYERDFLGIARRLTGDLDSARDIVHDAYAKVLSGDAWAKLTHPRAYMMRVIYNLGLNRLRDARVVPMQQYAKVETVTYADLGPDAFETLSTREEIERLMDAISKLPPQCRKVITMRKLEELRPKDIAQRLGISLSMVEKHLARGLVLLAEYLDVAETIIDQHVDSKAASRAPK